MKRFGLFWLLVLCCSCNLFTSKEQLKKQLVQEEIKSINWNEVDQYPLFEACDETASKEAQKVCFQTTLSDHLFNALATHNFNVTQSVNDTILVLMIIRNDGSIQLESITKTSLVSEQLPEIDSVITRALQRLPKIYPALKRGIQVSTKVKLPIVVSAQQSEN